MSAYSRPGHAWLVCPRLLELDPRHGQHPSKAPGCRWGRRCFREHKHEAPLFDPEGHRTAEFYWQPGSDSLAEHLSCTAGCHDVLRCDCGQQLTWTDLDDPGEVSGGG